MEVDPAVRLVDADRYFTAVGATVRVGGDRACYSTTADVILLPGFDRFDRVEGFYATSSHDHVHWTGHPARLGRDLSGRFGDRSYAGEELVAELGAAFWCAQFGLIPATRLDHAAYLASWLGLLGADPRALVTVCGHAQRALDHLNTLTGVHPLELLADHDGYDTEPTGVFGGVEVGADMIEFAVIPAGPIWFLQRQDRDRVGCREGLHVTPEPVPDLLDDRR